MSLAALLENIGVLGVPDGARFPEQVVQFRGIQPREERQLGHQRSVNRSHAGQSFGPADYCTSAGRRLPKRGGQGDSPLNLR